MKLVEEWKQSRTIEGVKGRDGGGDRVGEGDANPESSNTRDLLEQVNEEDESNVHHTENSNTVSAVDEDEDDEEISDPDDLLCTPSLAELAADVAVLSNPYKDKFGAQTSREDRTDDGRMAGGGRDIEKEKGRWPEKDKDSSSSPKGQKVIVKKVNPKGKGVLDSDFQTKAGLRAEEGDYSGLLVNGLFASSVLRTGSYYKAKDKAIVKVLFFRDCHPACLDECWS
jgi:hypothetical protein